MEKYKKINTLGGWILFLIASFVYLSTIEPTSSFWDCGEFISSSYKLEVGHPPGAPFFMLIGRFFTLFAGNNTHLVAIMINSLSALASAFTILFLFWTITHLLYKNIIKNSENDLSFNKILIITGSAAIGALAYTFSDTFWFSAVEGEVYATSSLFTAIVFWAILKWENEADQIHANRWIILIAYLIGLSIGVHLLNLLAIPAIVFVYYYKKYTRIKKGFVFAILLSIFLLGILMYGIIPGVVKIASWFELLFVNDFGLPYNSGVLFYSVILIALVIYGIWRTHSSGKVVLNTILIAFTVIIIGYSSYALIVIRSNANPPMDQNNPDNLFSLLYYLNREQYGDRPLFYGKYYDAPVIGREDGAPQYVMQNGKYEIIEYKPEYKYDDRFVTFFPRMYSDQTDHKQVYKEWGKVKGRPVRIRNYRGEVEVKHVPTFGENLRFFFSYQLGFMYFRYFMWNFSGRQNDIQGHGNAIHGNWISGIPFIDNARLGPQEEFPQSLANPKSRNKYYMLPLLLGIIGLAFHLNKNKKDFFIVTLLFVLTGIAIVVYLNQNPIQPRERDYAYAGSFYGFCIWIGIGVVAIFDQLKRILPKLIAAILPILLCLIFVPGLMAVENWDDHDRSGRYTARDFAYNYLNSCAPNAVLFTNGDNDTFPLWYAQEVEGIRTDVRVVNLSYLTADWYIDQLARKAYESKPLPFSLKKEQYKRGTRDIIPVYDQIKKYIDVKQIMDFVSNDDKRYKTASPFEQGEFINYIPTKRLKLNIDKNNILENNVVTSNYENQIVDSIAWTVPGNYILKNKLMILDLLANNNWERPIYYAITVSSDNYMNLQPYFQVEGLGYRIVPLISDNRRGETGLVNTNIMYDNMMNKFKWGRIECEDVFLDENNMRMLSNFRNSFARLADALLKENKKDLCINVINKCLDLMPNERVPYNYFMIPLARITFAVGEKDRGTEIINILFENTNNELHYFLSLEKKHSAKIDNEIRIGFHILQEIMNISKTYNLDELNQKASEELQVLYMTYSALIS